MERVPLRKPKLYFDTMAHPSHVTFDDGVEERRNVSWVNYVEARWDHLEPELIKIEIGERVVFLRGHNPSTKSQTSLANSSIYPSSEKREFAPSETSAHG